MVLIFFHLIYNCNAFGYGKKKNMLTKNVYYVQRNIYIYIYISILKMNEDSRKYLYSDNTNKDLGGVRGVMVIVTGYEHGDTSSIPGQD